MNLTVRELTVPDLANGFLESLASLTEVGLAPKDAIEVFRKRLRLGIRTFVALLDDQVVGTVSLLVEPKFIHGGIKVGHIEDIAVHVDHQRQGIGTLLVRHCASEAKNSGCSTVTLHCPERLVPFYTRIGFGKQDVGLRFDC